MFNLDSFSGTLSLSPTVTVSLNLLFGTVFPCRAAMIITTSQDVICPGEELVCTCMSQGTSQIWRIIGDSEDESPENAPQHIYSRTDGVGARGQLTDRNQNLYTFVLNSTTYENFVSTISVVATTSMHNIRLKCIGHLSQTSILIQIAGMPMSPQNIQSFVDMYHDYSSAVLITWDVPEDDSRVDYYQYLVIRGNTTIVARNISNTSVAISAVPYNENITFSVLAGNCIGESVEESEIINIVGCSKTDDSFSNRLLNVSAFSQAPGTEISLLCSTSDREEIVYSTCQDNGRWEPDPNSGLCQEDNPTNITVTDSEFITPGDYSTPDTMETIPQTPQMPITYLIYILASLIAVGSCSLTGVIIFCIFKLALRWKKGNLRGNNVNHEYYEVIGPVYEMVNMSAAVNNSGPQIRTKNNNAYEGVNIKGNEAYVHNTSQLGALQMDLNKSYQTSPFDSDVLVIPEKSTDARVLECCETQSLCTNENIQQASVSAQANAPVSQNNEQENPGESNVEINNSLVSCGLTVSDLTFEQQLLGIDPQC